MDISTESQVYLTITLTNKHVVIVSFHSLSLSLGVFLLHGPRQKHTFSGFYLWRLFVNSILTCQSNEKKFMYVNMPRLLKALSADKNKSD